jgi:two-component system alkaline phosphatase synthesis response regulator PhoP
VTTGEEAIEAARSKLPDVIILDLMLPGVDGLEVCRTLKRDSKTSHIPIVMLTAKSEEADIVAGLELGADDYITKPFSPRVLLARVKAVLRRKTVTAEKEASVLKRGGLMIDSSRYEVTVKGQAIELTSTEFRLLRFLAGRPGRVFTRHQIMDSVRGDDYVATDRSVDVQIAGLRKKLGPLGNHIETVRGVGYRFKD